MIHVIHVIHVMDDNVMDAPDVDVDADADCGCYVVALVVVVGVVLLMETGLFLLSLVPRSCG